MAETFTRFDAADYLKGPEAAAAYLEATISESGDDPAAIAHALGVIARSGNLSKLARATGLSREGLYKSLSDNGNPSLATVMTVARELGLQLHFSTREASATS